MDDPIALLESTRAKGEYLAETPRWKKYVSDLDGVDAAFTAIMLENTAKKLASIDETVRASNIGNFDRFAFPLVRAVFPNLVSQDLVSVQPMDGPVGLVFYFDITYGSTKGRIQAGTPVFSSLTGHPGDDTYSSDEVEEEAIATGNGSTANYTYTLGWTPLIPGTVRITDGSQVVTDDGNGRLEGHVSPGGTNTIDYTTGAIDVTFSSNVVNGDNVVADYRYVNEATDKVPELDLQLTSAPVVARINKLRTRYSLESAQNLRSQHGLSAETELVVALAQELRFEIDRTIIRDLQSIAQAATVSWDLQPPSNVSYTEHKLSFVDILIRGSSNIFQLTRRGQPNWVVMGIKASNVVESLPGFKASEQMQTPNGVIFAGVLNSRWRCYKDPYNIDNTDEQRNFLIGYKGPTFLEASYVYAPYIPFYSTPLVVLDDFIGRKGMATQWGRRKINGRFLSKGLITGEFSP